MEEELKDNQVIAEESKENDDNNKSIIQTLHKDYFEYKAKKDEYRESLAQYRR